MAGSRPSARWITAESPTPCRNRSVSRFSRACRRNDDPDCCRPQPDGIPRTADGIGDELVQPGRGQGRQHPNLPPGQSRAHLGSHSAERCESRLVGLRQGQCQRLHGGRILFCQTPMASCRWARSCRWASSNNNSPSRPRDSPAICRSSGRTSDPTTAGLAARAKAGSAALTIWTAWCPSPSSPKTRNCWRWPKRSSLNPITHPPTDHPHFLHPV
jgi:hypothetical protein